MKRDQSKKQEQKFHAEQKDQQVIRVRSSLRAGMVDDAALVAPCC